MWLSLLCAQVKKLSDVYKWPIFTLKICCFVQVPASPQTKLYRLLYSPCRSSTRGFGAASHTRVIRVTWTFGAVGSKTERKIIVIKFMTIWSSVWLLITQLWSTPGNGAVRCFKVFKKWFKHFRKPGQVKKSLNALNYWVLLFLLLSDGCNEIKMCAVN